MRVAEKCSKHIRVSQYSNENRGVVISKDTTIVIMFFLVVILLFSPLFSKELNVITKTNQETEIINSFETYNTEETRVLNEGWPMFGFGPYHWCRSPYNREKNDNEIKWKKEIGEDIPGALHIHSSPVIAPNRTIYLCAGNILFALDPQGNELWRYPTYHELYYSPAIGLNGNIYFANDDYFFIISPSGKELKKVAIDSPATTSITIAKEGNQYHVYFGTEDYLYAFTADGNLKWKYQPLSPSRIISTPSTYEGDIYFSTSGYQLFKIHDNGNSYSYQWNTTEMDFSCGTTLLGWNVLSGQYPKYYSVNSDGNIFNNVTIDGSIGRLQQGALNSDNTLLFLSTSSRFYAFSNEFGGFLTEEWNRTFGHTVSTSPAITNNDLIYAVDDLGDVYEFDKYGSKNIIKNIWSTSSSPLEPTSPVIGPDSTLFVACGNTLHAIGGFDIPNPPANVIAEGNASKITLSWSMPTDNGGKPITSYNVYRSVENNNNYELLTSDVTDTSYVDTNVVNGIKYYYKITAINMYGESDFCEEKWAIPGKLPTAPVNLKAEAGDGSVTLTWSQPNDDGGFPLNLVYNIYKGTESNNIDTEASNSSNKEYIDTEVENGITYYYQVSAENPIGEGPCSNYVEATPSSTPSAPRDVSISAGSNYIVISWDKPNSDGGESINGYNIYKGASAQGMTFFDTSSPTYLSYNDTNVINGETYHYQVAAKNSNGEGIKSSVVSATSKGSPTTPDNLRIKERDRSILLEWEESNDNGAPIIHYRIYRGLSMNNMVYFTNTNELQFEDLHLENGKIYYYQVSAINEVGESIKSNIVSGIPKGKPYPPRNVTAIGGNAKVYLNWEYPENDGGTTIIGYSIYKGVSGSNTVFFSNVDTNMYTDEEVENGICYYYKVTAINKIGESDFTEVISTTPQHSEGNIPGPVRNIHGVAGDGYVYFAWEEPKINSEYPILGYLIFRSDDGEDFDEIGQTSDLLYNDTTVENGVNYTYYIIALNEVGEGEQPTTVSVTPNTGEVEHVTPEEEDDTHSEDDVNDKDVDSKKSSDNNMAFFVAIGLGIVIFIAIVVYFLYINSTSISSEEKKPIIQQISKGIKYPKKSENKTSSESVISAEIEYIPSKKDFPIELKDTETNKLMDISAFEITVDGEEYTSIEAIKEEFEERLKWHRKSGYDTGRAELIYKRGMKAYDHQEYDRAKKFLTSALKCLEIDK